MQTVKPRARQVRIEWPDGKAITLWRVQYPDQYYGCVSLTLDRALAQAAKMRHFHLSRDIVQPASQP